MPLVTILRPILESQMNRKWMLVICAAAWQFGLSANAVTFEILGKADRPSGEKSVLVSDDGATVLSAKVGGNQFGAFTWRYPDGIITQVSRESNWYPWGISGDGTKIVGYQYPSNIAILDASYDGSVQAGGIN